MLCSASYYKNAYQYNPKNEIVWDEISRYLCRCGYISLQDKILDIAAGYYYFINKVNCSRKVAVDIAEEMVQYAANDVETYVISCTKLSSLFRDEFDIVFASNIFEHLTLEEFFNSLKEISLVLKVTGRLLIIQPNYRYCFKNYFDDYTHKTIFDHESISQALLQANFNREHSVILTVLMVVSERLQWGLAVFVGKVSIFNGLRYFGSPEGLGTNLWDLLQKTAQNRSSGGF